MTIHRNCEGLKRRDFLKAGAIGATGLTMANYMKMAEAGVLKNNGVKAAIFINLPGGPSHMDMFDLKPNAPKEFRGLFNPIETNVPGVEFCEHLPKLAQCADKFAILRGVTHTLGAHALGSEYVNTGTRPLPSIEHPGYGCVFTKENTSPKDLPPFVAIPSSRQKPGFLGVKYTPLNTGATPRAGQRFSVRGISLSNGLTVKEVEKRQNLLKELDTTFKGFEKDSQLVDALDKFNQQAYAMITSPKARTAFDISKENPSFAKPFGTKPFGLSCLLASRLISSGVPFVTISLGGWDTHRNNFASLKDRLLPTLDEGLSGLFNGLASRGLLDSTAIFVTGEFGRTPKINNRSTPGGRDHYPRCMFMLMAGGSVKGGQVVGQSNANATGPESKGISPADVAASFYHNLGIDHTQEYKSTTGRPIMIVRDGHVIPELFA